MPKLPIVPQENTHEMLQLVQFRKIQPKIGLENLKRGVSCGSNVTSFWSSIFRVRLITL